MDTAASSTTPERCGFLNRCVAMKCKIPIVYTVAFSVNLLAYGAGIGYGWSSPALPKLKGTINNPLDKPITVSEEAWIGSLISLGALCSPFLTAVLSEKIGRKKTILAFSLPMIASHIFMIVARTVWEFYVARFLIGLSVGCSFAIVPTYSAEISEKHNRGSVGIIMLLMLGSGHFTASVVGPYVTIRTFSILALIPAVIFVLTVATFIPETPYYYVLIDDKINAKISLKKLRESDDVSQELNEIIKEIEEEKLASTQNPVKEFFTSRTALKAFFWSVALMFFNQTTGVIYIVNNTQHIFSTAKTPFSDEIPVMLFTGVQLMSMIFSSQIIDRFPRKRLLIISLGLVLSNVLALGAYFQVQTETSISEKVSWLPIAFLLLFILCFNLGMNSIAYIFPGEIFEPKLKSLGINLVMVLGLSIEFSVGNLLPEISDRFGFATPFWIFSICNMVGIIFIWLVLPETGGKSFMEIQDYIKNKNNIV